MKALCATAFFALLVSANALAQSSPAPALSASPASDPCGGNSRLLATLNRPTVGYSPCSIEKGTVVFEEGYQNTVQGGGANRLALAQYPQSFIRVGVRDRFEVDVLGPFFNRLAASTPAGIVYTRGYSDSGIGFKYELPPGGKLTVGIDGLYTAPSGTNGFSFGGGTETANLDVAYSLSSSSGVGTTLAFLSTAGANTAGITQRYSLFLPSFVATQQLAGQYQLYAEYVYASKLAPDVSGGRAFVDYGVQKLLGKRFEVDAELGQSITPVSTLKFTYAGVGFGFQIR